MLLSLLQKPITGPLLLLALCNSPSIAAASSVLLSGGTVIAFDQSTQGLQVLRNNSVLIVNDRINSIFDSSSSNITIPPGTEEVDVTGKIISPGFVDTHRHGWQTAFKTIASNTSLAEYFSRYGEFASQDLFTADDIYWGQLAGHLENLNAGVTTILDHAHGSWSDATAQAGLNASIDSGARVFHAFTVHQLTNNYTIDDQLAKLKSIGQEGLYKNTSVSLGLAYDAFCCATPDVVNSVIAAATEANVSVVTTHCLGGPWSYYNSPTVLNTYNYLNTSTPVVFSHASFLQTNDAALLRSTNQYISTTPESELHYGHDHPQTYLIQDQASLGIDTHFTYSADVITQARIWLQTVRQTLYRQVTTNWDVPTNNPMSVNQAFLLATQRGGLALRRPDLGIIAPGAKADVVIFGGDSPGMLGWVDPVAAVILHSHVGDIESVIVDGKWVKRNGSLTYENYAGVQESFLQSARRIQGVWKDTPYPVLEGTFAGISEYAQAIQEDTLRGPGTGYGTVLV